MGFVRLARVLWRRRVAVLAGALIALALAAVGVHRGGGTPAAATALSKVLIDTPESLVASARAPGAATIATRTRLVAGLVADEGAKATIARRAGLKPAELGIAGPGAAAPPRVITPLAEQAIEVAKPTQPYLASIEVVPGQPILSIAAHAADPAAAVRLGRAVVATLPAVASGAPGGGGVAVEPLGRPTVLTTPARSGTTKVIVGALVFFFLWCLGCVVGDRVRSRRAPRRDSRPPGRRRRWHEVEGALE